MCKEHFIKHKTGYLTGLVIALFAVAALLLARAGYLGEGALNLTGDIGRTFNKVMPARIAPKVMPGRVNPVGVQYPEVPKIAPNTGKIAPTGKIDPVTGKVITDPTPTKVAPAGIQDPELIKVAPTGKIDPVTGKVIIDPTPTKVAPTK